MGDEIHFLSSFHQSAGNLLCVAGKEETTKKWLNFFEMWQKKAGIMRWVAHILCHDDVILKAGILGWIPKTYVMVMWSLFVSCSHHHVTYPGQTCQVLGLPQLPWQEQRKLQSQDQLPLPLGSLPIIWLLWSQVHITQVHCVCVTKVHSVPEIIAA